MWRSGVYSQTAELREIAEPDNYCGRTSDYQTARIDSHGRTVINKHEVCKPYAPVRAAILTGYERAAKEKIATHEACQGWAHPLERGGCYKYVDEHFTPPHIKQAFHLGDKTPEQCREEVSRFYEYRHHAEHVKGNTRYAYGQGYQAELERCEIYQNTRTARVTDDYLKTLNALIKKAEDGGQIDDAERARITSDLAAVMDLPDHPYTRSYRERSQYFFQLADGLVEPRGKERLDLSCNELQAGLERLRQENEADNAELNRYIKPIPDANGNPTGLTKNTNGQRSAELNTRKINRHWDVARYVHNIERLDCGPPVWDMRLRKG
jgi:hypothetical protein